MSKSTSVVGGAFPCPVKGCGRAFEKKSGLIMHNNRVHHGVVLVPGQKQKGPGWGPTRTKQSEEERLAKKRAYNRKYRRRKGMAVRPLAQKEPKMNGAVWTPERRAKHASTWRSKMLARQKAKRPDPGAGRHHFSDEQLEVLEGIGFVAIMEAIGSAPEHMQDPRQFINNCPGCGYRLQPHYLAAGFKQP